ncbi:MAG: RNA polymerase II transcription factor B subunit 4 [Cirrosporium novae-zelandiae]|nr:MAG: RNA polymerase II transcription factor B subunit 4 [Cirrosporium novae-zelandiae]
MNAVDDSEHYTQASNEPPPSLLAIILDTNPHVWELLSPSLRLSKAIANILVFINAHLAFNYANKVAVVASHSQSAYWLYPSPHSEPFPSHLSQDTTGNGDIQMTDVENTPVTNGNSARYQKLHLKPPAPPPTTSANKYRPFRLIEDEILHNLKAVFESTEADSLSTPTTSPIAGALTLVIGHINRQIAAISNTSSGATSATTNHALDARILIISLSPDLSHQYIPLMNLIFSSQRIHIPLDVIQLTPQKVPPTASTFLQQAADASSGIYMQLPPNPSIPLTGPLLLQTLLMAYLPPPSTRAHLISPTTSSIDFRAACFCHRRIVSTGYVCSVCFSIFCSPPAPPSDMQQPPGTSKSAMTKVAACLTCGTPLRLDPEDIAKKPRVVPQKKKKRKRRHLDMESTSEMSTPGPA